MEHTVLKRQTDKNEINLFITMILHCKKKKKEKNSDAEERGRML